MKLEWKENNVSQPGERCIDIHPAGRMIGVAYIQSFPEGGFSDDAAFALADSICKNCEVELDPKTSDAG